MIEQRDRTIRIAAAALGVAGLVTLGSLLLAQGIPQPLWLLGLLTVGFVVLDNAAVEVGDGLYLSASAMVVFTAAVVFGGEQGPAAAAVMAACTVARVDLIRPGRWAVAVVNTVQIMLGSVLAIAVFSALMPGDVATRADVGPIAFAAVIAAGAYPWINFGAVSLLSRRLFPDRPLPRARHQITNNAALAVLGVLGALLGAVYVLGGAVVLPLLFVTYLVGHIGFRTNAHVREAHEATIRGLVRAIEALDSYGRGHAERVAHFVALAAARLGLDPSARTRLRWAAYVHDVGQIAVPAEMLHRAGPVPAEQQERVIRQMAVVESILAEVDFLAPVIEVVRQRHRLVAGTPQGDESVEARLLASADLFDGLTSARSHRAAVTQREAFAELRSRAAALGGDVVEAVIVGIERSGEVYGSPDADSTAAVEHLVRERAIRA